MTTTSSQPISEQRIEPNSSHTDQASFGFDDLDLIRPLHRALSQEGYTTPTAIQAETIPPALEGRDVLGCAQTGTGKTAAFALPVLNALSNFRSRPGPGRPLALVLAPTRELAIQIGDSFRTYGRHTKVRHAVIFGGVSQHRQVQSLNRGVHLVIATPGRLLDLMDQGYIDLDHLEMFILDEADRMMDMGFMPDLKRIIRCLPSERQSLFFSATLPKDIVDLSRELLTDPVTINVTPKKRSVANIRQEVLLVQKSEKLSLLDKILMADDVDQAIVFTRTKRSANLLEKKLDDRGFSVAAIHGNKSQGARQRVLKAFRDSRVQILVATDVAARGIDVDGITHVINYDVPTEPESYVHRIGRTGRAGAHGVAVTFVTSDQRSELQAIERLIGKTLLDKRLLGKDSSKKSDPRPRRSFKKKPHGSSRPYPKKSSSSPSGDAARRPKASGKAVSATGDSNRGEFSSSDRDARPRKSVKSKRNRPGRKERQRRAEAATA